MISTVFYYIWNVLSLGLIAAFKVSVRKGIAEANQETAALVRTQAARAA